MISSVESKTLPSKEDQPKPLYWRKARQLVKETPAAYGLSGEPHYYFIHSYNCLYECDYCYLQGYFHSPDLFSLLTTRIFSKKWKVSLRSIRKKGIKRFGFMLENTATLRPFTPNKELPQYFDFLKRILKPNLS